MRLASVIDNFQNRVTLCKLWSFEYCLIISNVAFVCLTYVAIGSIEKCSMSLFKAFINYGSPCSIWIRKKRKSENADDTKQIEDDTKQNCGMKTYGICGSPRVPIL
ncbi:hypothetical protein T4D_10662 [Trichinella pseudospiralis]|uniref:Uncharacterized protein n=1 Tax=Trichinella pseudospiralis TaxID=6337 RepID=A0A0V1FQ32_TRIPS|nr:hypothetical protein T4D_10662 [Trichinella pseudospiralis]